MERVMTKDILKSINDYSTVIKNEDLNTLTEQGIVCAEPFYMTKNAMSKEHLERLWLPSWCNTVILLQGGNLKSVVWRRHCWAIMKGHLNKNWYPVFHKKKGVWCWLIDKKFKYTKYTWEENVSLILWNQLDVWYTLEKDWIRLREFRDDVDFTIDFDLNIIDSMITKS